MMNNQPQQYTHNEVSLSEEGSNFRDIYQSRVLETESEYADEMEVDLAEGWQRIVAGIIDWVLWSVFMVPMQLAGVLAILGGVIGGSWQAEDKLLLLGLVLITIAFCIYQIVIMAKDGQSLGFICCDFFLINNIFLIIWPHILIKASKTVSGSTDLNVKVDMDKPNQL